MHQRRNATEKMITRLLIGKRALFTAILKCNFQVCTGLALCKLCLDMTQQLPLSAE